MKNPDDAILREILSNFLGNNIDISSEVGLWAACSLAIQLTTLQAASHSRYHVHQETSEGPEDRSAGR